MRTIGIVALMVLSFIFYSAGLGVLIIFTLAGIGALLKPGHDPADDIQAALFGIMIIALLVIGVAWLWGVITSWVG